MIWDVDSLEALSRVVDRKFDEFRANVEAALYELPVNLLDQWKEYLKIHGIERLPGNFKKRGSEEPCVWIECPWSVRYSTPGAVYTKSHLYFPMDLAEKIILLEGMP